MIDTLIFDLDDTLILERDYIESGFKEVADFIGKAHHLEKNTIFNSLVSEFEISSKNVFNRVLERFDIKYTSETIFNLLNIYREHTPKISFAENCDELLIELKAKGYKLGIITDGYKETQINKVEAIKLEKFVDFICITDELGSNYWKPHPYPFLKALQELESHPKNTIYVGDNEEKDFITSKAMGMKTVQIIRKNGIYKNNERILDADFFAAEYKIRSLFDLKKLLKEVKNDQK